MGALPKSNPNLFRPGCAPGPGRPPGMRNQLSEVFLQALASDFVEHGPAAIAKVLSERPHHYLSIVASLLPRQLHVERSSPFADLTDDELDQLERYLSASRAQSVQEINGRAAAIEPEKP
jgi:hypothetical protein